MKVYKFTVTFEGEGVSEAEAFEEGVMEFIRQADRSNVSPTKTKFLYDEEDEEED